ncbi:MAG TPA: DUF108 domain-containing protein [Candidatus Omnitrophota bacterium]|nr:DUF108 domain-containing protein [Candidatus Omnitrophota bacterium]
MKGKIKVGIVGCGAIGTQLAHVIEKKFSARCRLVCLNDLLPEKAGLLRSILESQPSVVSQEKLIRESDFIIEAASAKVVLPLLKKGLPLGKSVLVMSVGALLVEDQAVRKLVGKGKGTIFLPSGAIAGLDGLLAARTGGIQWVRLTTRKPPRALEGAPYVQKRGFKLAKLRNPKLIFQGSAREAVSAFPENINVAALVSLAGIGPQRTKVQIYAVPGLKRNVHEIEIVGTFGRLKVITENVPSPRNPKTSYLAMLAPGALLEKIFGMIKIGT